MKTNGVPQLHLDFNIFMTFNAIMQTMYDVKEYVCPNLVAVIGISLDQVWAEFLVKGSH